MVGRYLCVGLLLGGAVASVTTPVLALSSGERPDALWHAVPFSAFYLAGAVAYAKRPASPVARRMLALGALLQCGMLTGTACTWLLTENGQLPWLWAVNAAATLWGALALAMWIALFAVFPDGVYQAGYERAVVWAAFRMAPLFPLLAILTGPTQPISFDLAPHLETPSPLYLPALSPLAPVVPLQFVAPLVGVVLLVLRYRRLSGDRRVQVRWLLAPALVLGLMAAASALAEPLMDGAVGDAPWDIALTLLPLALVVALLRYRLLDVDRVIRRSLLYATLWGVIATAYASLAAVLGLAAGARTSAQVAVVVTLVAALLFLPARRWLEALAGRWVYGHRLSGYDVVRQFGATLEHAFDLQELAATIAAAARTGVAAQWARVRVGSEGEQIVAVEPTGGDRLNSIGAVEVALCIPLVHGDERVATLECGPKKEGQYTEEDRDLLTTLSRQAAAAVRNGRLTADLTEIEEQARELAASRTRIVQAEEAERRRIERDIHDGVQQSLVALLARLELARTQVNDAHKVGLTLESVQSDLRQALADLREFARGIHPAVLGDRGLVEAIQCAGLDGDD